MVIKIEHSKEDWRKTGLKQFDGQMPRGLDAKSIMNNAQDILQPIQGAITDYVKKHDSENSAGAIKHQLQTLDKLLKKGGDPLSSVAGMLGQSQVNNVNESINNHQQDPKCPQGQRWDLVQKKCVIDCPVGQIWDITLNKCVIDDSIIVGEVSNIIAEN
jgi:hypothetical protein